LDQAQYRDLEAFAKFGSDLDAATTAVLEKGKRNVEILKQAQYSPVSVEKQIAIIYLGTNGLLREIPLEHIREFEETYVTSLAARYPEVLNNLRAGKLLDEDTATLRALADELKTQYKS
jgi:F-type H+-transporting ATPase subunit alpha